MGGNVGASSNLHIGKSIGNRYDLSHGSLSFPHDGATADSPTIKRNISDDKPSLVIIQEHASATGDLLHLSSSAIGNIMRVSGSGDLLLRGNISSSQNFIANGNISGSSLSSSGNFNVAGDGTIGGNLDVTGIITAAEVHSSYTSA